MICPKCGFEQPDGPECMRCGIIVSRYKGPVLGAGGGAGGNVTPPPFAPIPASPPPPPPAFIPPPPVISGGTAMSPGPPSPPPPADGGTVYGGTVYGGDPGGTVYSGGGGTVYGGTVYEGPPPAGSAPLAGYGAPAFHGADFTAGKVLGETFSVYFANFVPFVLLSLLISLPLFVGGAYLSSNEPSPQLAALLILAALPLFLVVSQVVTAGVTYGVYQRCAGRAPRSSTVCAWGSPASCPSWGSPSAPGWRSSPARWLA